MRYNQFTRAVHVVAQNGDSAVDVQISRAAIEHLAGTTLLNKDDSFTAVVRHKDILERAADTAIANHRQDGKSISVRPSDIEVIQNYPVADDQRDQTSHK